ncbi:WD40-like Beta Propeller repeat and WD40/YVTN repeat-like-containing domain-containing protein [Strongyloides ratti]|uniref:WD40-like Beta Propeller repeat and WD40/YVTN repeat-like-containing domain-containing protein n=1 Tax=Strongyloides ratti TaxID=34506 RepID=A0A090LM27_STRRB|nr:WD40-like Beta Propeller repeat and WD40/YVTN repeat-like-containing domain-containing protein [Strongyloides ratti]CEF68615.1 WD40-like Beta Propeller repeat and WD40/YVTN repeat-like-containing domain-containing protein [Strongyloides ratti]
MYIFLLFSILLTVYCRKEEWLHNITRITSGVVNLFPNLSDDGKFILFQGSGFNEYGTRCSGIYRKKLSLIDGKENTEIHRISNGLGSSSNGKFISSNYDVIYSGTFRTLNVSMDNKDFDISKTCPESICNSKKRYSNKTIDEICKRPLLKNVFSDYDIYKINKYGIIVSVLTNDSSYNSEATQSPDGKWIAYTSGKLGTLDIWLMSSNGSEKRQLTNIEGYEGSPSWSFDSQYILYTGYIPQTKQEISDFYQLLSLNLLDISKTEIFLISIDGLKWKQLTYLNASTFGATWISSDAFIFSSNFEEGKSGIHDFNLYIYNLTTGKIKRITWNDEGFDSFPSYNPKLNILSWVSNRLKIVKQREEYNIFVAYLGKPSNRPFFYKENEKNINNVNEYIKVHDTHYPGETHLKNIRQLTYGGQNAEGYFIRNDSAFIFQAMGQNYYNTGCDQIYRYNLEPNLPSESSIPQKISVGLGTTTCSFLFPSNKKSIHASTIRTVNLNDNILNGACPPKKCKSEEAKTDQILKNLCNTSYVWDVFPEYDIYLVNEYGNFIKQLTFKNGYDAEGTINPNGTKIVYTSMASGDLELWIMNSDGSKKKQLTNELGYDGGAFFSPDGNKIIFRASRPKSNEEIKKYKLLLRYGLVEPLNMELFVINADGTGLRQITNLGGSNWAPYYLTDNKRILFSSNFNSTKAHFGEFHIYMINEDGTGLEQVSYN